MQDPWKEQLRAPVYAGGNPAGKQLGRKGPGGYQVNMDQQCAFAVKNVDVILGCINQSIVSKSREVYIKSPVSSCGLISTREA